MGAVKRLDDWREALVKYLEGVKRTPYQPGRHDCALFAATAVKAMTGHDYAVPYRGRYTTLRGGLRVLRKDGYDDHIALAADKLPEISPAFARAGDLAVVPGEDNLPALGVVQGEKVYVLTPGGLSLVSMLSMQRAFEV